MQTSWFFKSYTKRAVHTTDPISNTQTTSNEQSPPCIQAEEPPKHVVDQEGPMATDQLQTVQDNPTGTIPSSNSQNATDQHFFRWSQ